MSFCRNKAKDDNNTECVFSSVCMLLSRVYIPHINTCAHTSNRHHVVQFEILIHYRLGKLGLPAHFLERLRPSRVTKCLCVVNIFVCVSLKRKGKKRLWDNTIQDCKMEKVDRGDAAEQTARS